MRAREPDATGVVERDGVRVPYEVFGSGEPTILLLPSWAIVHARQWKMQVPHLARHHRVVVLETRGNGAADRPLDPAAYLDREHLADAVDVLDALGVARAVVVGTSGGGRHALQLAARHPDRVLGVVAIAPALPVPLTGFDDPEATGLFHRQTWEADYPGFVERFMAAMFTEEHSLKQREDGVAWARETTSEVLVTTVSGFDDADAEAIARSVRCPVLMVHGDDDRIIPPQRGADLARWSGGALVTLEGSGHGPAMRDPVRVTLLIREFAARFAPPAPRRWTRASRRRRRRCSSARRSGWGTCTATWRSPTSCGCGTPTWRSTG